MERGFKSRLYSTSAIWGGQGILRVPFGYEAISWLLKCVLQDGADKHSKPTRYSPKDPGLPSST